MVPLACSSLYIWLIRPPSPQVCHCLLLSCRPVWHRVPRVMFNVSPLPCGTHRQSALRLQILRGLRIGKHHEQIAVAGIALSPSTAGLPLAAPRKEAQAWHQRLRLAQEALTLLRGLSVQPQVRAMVLEDHVSSAASILSCLATAGTSPRGRTREGP